MPESVISFTRPQDGRDWDFRCARCGSIMEWAECDWCRGDGVDEYDYQEDCDVCLGEGGWYMCQALSNGCDDKALIGREGVKHGAIEWVVKES